MRPVAIEGEPKVRDLEMTRGRNEKIVRFDVAMDKIQTVGLLDGQDHLGNVEASHRLVENVLANQQPKKVAPRHVFHDEIKAFWVLEASNQGNNPAQ